MRSDWEERQAPALLTPPGLRTPLPPPPMSSPVLTLVLVRRASSTRRMPELEWVLGLGLGAQENLFGAGGRKTCGGQASVTPTLLGVTVTKGSYTALRKFAASCILRLSMMLSCCWVAALAEHAAMSSAPRQSCITSEAPLKIACCSVAPLASSRAACS